MPDNELTLSARVSQLERQMAEHQGQLTQLNQFVTHSNRLIIWQIIIFALVMVGTLLGTIARLSP